MAYSGYLSGYGGAVVPPPPPPPPPPSVYAPPPALPPVFAEGRPARTWTVLARDFDRNVLGPLQGWKLNLDLKFNEVGAWTLDIDRAACPPGWPGRGSGIIILEGGAVRASGMVDAESFAYTAEAGGYGTWSLTGDTDLGRLAYRIVYPNPTLAWSTQNVDAYYVRAGEAETVLRQVVSEQAGPDAPAARYSGVQNGTYVGYPAGDVRVSERFTPLLDVLRSTALAGGGLGFDVVADLTDNSVRFDVYKPVDRTSDARFSVEAGNVTGLNVTRQAPTATVALVAGSGQLQARNTLELADPGADSAWGRREGPMIDQRQSTDPLDYAKAAYDALSQGAEQVSASANIIDTATVQIFRDINLGDRASVVTPFGDINDLVRGINVAVEDTGDAVITSTIGTVQAVSDSSTDRIIRGLLRRLSYLEAAL